MATACGENRQGRSVAWHLLAVRGIVNAPSAFNMTKLKSTRCFGAAVSVLFCTAFASAQVITVGPPGSGAQHQYISAGIAAAPPGGVVLVAAGVYIENFGLTIDKPMTLLGAGSSQTTFRAAAPYPLVALGNLPVPITIRDLAAGEEVVVAGLEVFASTTFEGPFASAVTVSNCAGAVALTDVNGTTAAANMTSGVAVVHNSALVTMDGCSFVNELATSLLGFGTGVVPTPGIFATNSLVHVTDCIVQGGKSYGHVVSYAPHDGAAGISADGAIVRLARSVVTGGAGAAPAFLAPVTVVTNGGAAIEATASQVLIRGGNGNLLTGGQGGITSTAPVLFGVGGPAIHLHAGSLSSTTPDVAMMAGPDGDNQVTMSTVNGSGLHAALPFPLPILAAANKLVAPGSAVLFDVSGEAGAVCLSLLSTQQTNAYAVQGILGVFTLPFSAVVPLPVVTLDAAGTEAFSVPLPANPSLVGISAYSQTVSFGPGGWVVVSSPTCFVVR